MDHERTARAVHIPVRGGNEIEGDLTVPTNARGVVLFAHGSGSSRHSPRNRYVASVLVDAGFATLLMDLLTAEEEYRERVTRHLRFDIELLSERLENASEWLATAPETRALALGYFGASTGAAAALVAACTRSDVRAIVSRGGRPDLAGEALGLVRAPTLFIVGSDDPQVLELNRHALRQLASPRKRLEIVPGASHLFEEPGTLETVAELAKDFFAAHLAEARTAPVQPRPS